MSTVTLGGKATADNPILFEAVADEVFHRYGRTWKRTTLAVNQVYLRNQILPWFRGRPVADITRGDVRQWFRCAARDSGRRQPLAPHPLGDHAGIGGLRLPA